MTTVTCDFCGKVIGTENDPGDAVLLGDPDSLPDARNDACGRCLGLLYLLRESKDLQKLSALADSMKPSTQQGPTPKDPA